MVNIGNSAYVREYEVEAIAPPESAPLKRLVNEARDSGRCIDLTYGKKTKSILFLKSGKVILSAYTVATLVSNLKRNDLLLP